MSTPPPPPAPPASPWLVRILDLSGGAEDSVVEEIGGFASLADANAFARRYVRDSVERCRTDGASADDVLRTWFAFGEDARVEGGEGAWHSGAELADFARAPAAPPECDWRALDPRARRRPAAKP